MGGLFFSQQPSRGEDTFYFLTTHSPFNASISVYVWLRWLCLCLLFKCWLLMRQRQHSTVPAYYLHSSLGHIHNFRKFRFSWISESLELLVHTIITQFWLFALSNLWILNSAAPPLIFLSVNPAVHHMMPCKAFQRSWAWPKDLLIFRSLRGLINQRGFNEA